MIELGIDSLKVEGRMKSMHYIATVISVYRKVIDAYSADPDNFVIKQEWLDELDKCANRDTAPAFFEGSQDTKSKCLEIMAKRPNLTLLELYLITMLIQKWLLCSNEIILNQAERVEFFGPEIENFTVVIDKIMDEEGNELDAGPSSITDCPI